MIAIGVDLCAKSERALVVRRAGGVEFGGAVVVRYPFGDKGVRLDESDHRLARQNPGDCLYAHNRPIAANKAAHDKLYALCRQLHDSFGGLNTSIDLSRFMKGPIEIKYARRGCVEPRGASNAAPTRLILVGELFQVETSTSNQPRRT